MLSHHRLCARAMCCVCYAVLCCVVLRPCCRYLTAGEQFEVPLPEPGFHDNSHMKCPRISQQNVGHDDIVLLQCKQEYRSEGSSGTVVT